MLAQGGSARSIDPMIFNQSIEDPAMPFKQLIEDGEEEAQEAPQLQMLRGYWSKRQRRCYNCQRAPKDYGIPSRHRRCYNCRCHIIGQTYHNGCRYYIIRANIEGQEHVVKASYSDFIVFDRMLQEMGQSNRNVRLPRKGVLGLRDALNTSCRKEKLQRQLERYLDQQLQLGGPAIAE